MNKCLFGKALCCSSCEAGGMCIKYSFMKLSFRPATEEDAEELLAIYAPYVRDTAISMEYDVPSVEEFRRRIRTVSAHFPYIVACDTDGAAVGYVYAHKFHERIGYQFSAEMSIYVKQGIHGQGVGKALYGQIEPKLRAMGMAVLYASISTSPRNPDPHLTDASVRFHEKMGYHLCGTFTHSTYKFGLWYNMIYMEKALY